MSWLNPFAPKPKSGFNPLGNIGATKNTTSGAVSRAGSEAAVKPARKYSGPMIDPNTGASQIPAGDPNANPPGGPYSPPEGPYSPPVDTAIDPNGWRNDTEYANQMSALEQALKMYDADQAAQRLRYKTSYDEGLNNLGWKWDSRPDDKTLENLRYDQIDQRWENNDQPIDVRGQFDRTDRNTAAGRSFTNQINDFASRGMLRSSAFAQAQNDLNRNLLQQLGGVQNARADFMNELTNARTAFTNQNTADRRSAENEAIARYNALYGLA